MKATSKAKTILKYVQLLLNYAVNYNAWHANAYFKGIKQSLFYSKLFTMTGTLQLSCSMNELISIKIQE